MTWNDMERINRSRVREELGGFGMGIKLIAGAVVLAIVGVILLVLTEQVGATSECVVTNFGKEVGRAGPGIHLTLPGTDFKCYDVSQKTMELVAGDPAASNSKANYVDWAIRARSLDGIDQYAMLTMQFHTDRDAVTDLYPTYPDDEAVKEQLVKSRLRSVVPQFLSLTGATEQYKGNLGPISDEIEAELKRQLDPFGIRVDYFELKRSDFDDVFETAIRDRAKLSEEAEKNRLAQQVANEEAKRVQIVTKTENDKLIANANAKAEVDTINAENAARLHLIEAETAAKAKNLETDAATYDLEQRGAALEASPSLIELERAQALRDAGAIYLPSGALPIMNLPVTP
jgi:hypothetical protein